MAPRLVRAGWGGGLLGAVSADPGRAPVTGDRVALWFWPDHRITVESIAPRRSPLSPAETDGTTGQPNPAANVDVVAVVEALLPDPN